MNATPEDIRHTLKNIDTRGIAVLSTRHILDETKAALLQIVEEIEMSPDGRSKIGHTLERAASILKDLVKEVLKAGGSIEVESCQEHTS